MAGELRPASRSLEILFPYQRKRSGGRVSFSFGRAFAIIFGIAHEALLVRRLGLSIAVRNACGRYSCGCLGGNRVENPMLREAGIRPSSTTPVHKTRVASRRLECQSRSPGLRLERASRVTVRETA